MKRFACLLLLVSLGCDKNSTVPTPPPIEEGGETTGDVTEKTYAPDTTPLPKVDESSVGRIVVPLAQEMGLVFDVPTFPEDTTRPTATLYLTFEGGVVESRADAGSFFELGEDAACEEFIADGGALELGGAKVARLVLGCRIGEDAISTTEYVALLEAPAGRVTSLAQLSPRWKGEGGQINSLFWAQCVTDLTASYALEGDELVITRKGKAEYAPENPEEPDVAKEDCVAPDGSTERAPWKKAP